jgi:hypothetical protein
MTATSSELQHLKRGIALLAACIASNLEQIDPTFSKRFLDSLARAYDANRPPNYAESMQQLELFAWTRDYMKSMETAPSYRGPIPKS